MDFYSSRANGIFDFAFESDLRSADDQSGYFAADEEANADADAEIEIDIEIERYNNWIASERIALNCTGEENVPEDDDVNYDEVPLFDDDAALQAMISNDEALEQAYDSILKAMERPE